ncbi:fibroblast growth factor receptor 2-like [Hydra vulgaris]|uniref:fibroblast growth factor receptor 2-like n=1 Tax=Hydra vulgaris TaxID=6087 RepID=UPI0032EA154C
MDYANQLEFNDFTEEINLMKGIGYHKNIVNMIGCSTLEKPLCLVVELMENGDLLQFLKNRRTKKINSSSEKVSVDDNEKVTPNDLISFAWQVASGMEYISSIKLVHRDLAARNILVGADKIVKISDFGLTRKVNADLNYMGSNNRRLPIKWMSIEAIFDRTFTTYSDVWAYGIVLFEIVTLGGTPYPTISNRELLPLLKTGYRMERPDNCSQPMFDCMLHCWNKDPLQRPTFTKLRELFEEIMSESGNYFSFDINEESSYYKLFTFNSNSNDFNEFV